MSSPNGMPEASMVFDVRPGEGIGPLRVGMTRREVAAAASIAGLDVADFRRGNAQALRDVDVKTMSIDQIMDVALAVKGPADLRIAGQLFAYFNGGEFVEQLEVAISGGPHRVKLLDIDFEATYADVQRQMAAHGRVDESDPEYPSACVYYDLGLSLWADATADDLDEVSVEAVLISRPEPGLLD